MLLYFPRVFDMKFLMKHCRDALHGGLQKLADALEVERIGPQHQAGSDALLTCRTFMKLREVYFPPPDSLPKGGDGLDAGLAAYENVLYGLGVDGAAPLEDAVVPAPANES